MSPMVSDPIIGSMVGTQHRAISLIAEGGRGRVYRGQSADGDTVALKVLFGEIAADEDCRARLDREVALIGGLRHPNVVHFIDTGTARDHLVYMIMELVEGETLRAKIARGPMAIADALHIVVQLADGLDYAHQNGVLHRDLKPENVMLTHDGVAKLADFGLARALTPSNSDRITQENLVAGTPAWMSPEQLTGSKIDARSDLFSLGLMLFEMLAGRPPYDGNPFEQGRRILNDPLPLLGMRNPAVRVPQKVESFMHQMLARRPGDRPASARQVADTIRSWRRAAP